MQEIVNLLRSNKGRVPFDQGSVNVELPIQKVIGLVMGIAFVHDRSENVRRKDLLIFGTFTVGQEAKTLD